MNYDGNIKWKHWSTDKLCSFHCGRIRFYNMNWLSKWDIQQETKFENEKKKFNKIKILCLSYEMKLWRCMKKLYKKLHEKLH